MFESPFPFHGAWPTDWYEGAAGGHRLTVAFERAPTDDELRALGALYARTMLEEAPVSERWSGRFLELTFGEPEREPTETAEHLAAPRRFLRHAHGVLPIVDAVYHNAREGSDAGPKGVELGEPIERPAVDDFTESASFAEGKATSRTEPAAPAKKTPAKTIRFVTIDDPSDALRAALANERPAVERENPGALSASAGGATLVALKGGKYRRTLSFTDASGEETDLSWSIDDDLEDNILSLSLAPRTTAAFVLTEGRALRITLPDEEVETIAELPDLCDIEAASDDLVVLADGSSVRWYARRDGGWVEQAREELKAAHYLLAVTPSVVAVLSMDPVFRKSPKEPLHVYVFDGERARHVGASKEHPRAITIHDGRWVLRTAKARIYALEGLPV